MIDQNNPEEQLNYPPLGYVSMPNDNFEQDDYFIDKTK